MVQNVEEKIIDEESGMVNRLGMEFIKIKGGSFVMGSSESEKGRVVHEELHSVDIEQDFFLQRAPVTVGQWKRFIESENYATTAEVNGWGWGCYPSEKKRMPLRTPVYEWKMRQGCTWFNPGFSQTDDHPVTVVSWDDARKFSEWLGKRENSLYRLPTEAEWEYSCRAESQSSYSFGSRISTGQANFRRRISSNLRRLISFDRNFPVYQTTLPGRFKPNKWGLYDMHGNVWEWCLDSCDMETEPGRKKIIRRTYPDPTRGGTETGTHRILKGGSWFYSSNHCRSAYRRALTPDDQASGIGFRLVCEIGNSN